MVGIVQEQHPDRARLFMQWKEMGWPVLVDAYDLLEVPYVPITLTLDEHGVVRELHPPLGPAGLSEEFLATDFSAPEGGGATAPTPPDLEALRDRARAADGDPDAWRDHADALAVWGGPERLDETIAAYRRVVERAPDDRWAHFRLGVALRDRFDSSGRREGDFQAAVDHWSRALELDPNQYIFRRRLQQYGPRLDKPYPFYDWVHAAREEIRSRGEEPLALAVEPRGSEFARPARRFEADTAASEADLDPDGVIQRDDGFYVEAETTVVPAAVEPGGSVRVHVRFEPNAANDAHWNNEVDDLKLWVEPPAGWSVDRRLHVVGRPERLVSEEARVVELELRAPDDLAEGEASEVPAYALYYVCEGVNGICVYRRKDLSLRVPVAGETGGAAAP